MLAPNITSMDRLCMLLLVSPFKRLGFVLIALGMLSLVLVGGSFAHTHEVSMENVDRGHSHIHHQHLDHQHHDGAIGEDKPLHCGAPILTLVVMTDGNSVLPKEQYICRLNFDLTALVFTPDPPPPRFV